jgi:hypothetical protein
LVFKGNLVVVLHVGIDLEVITILVHFTHHTVTLKLGVIMDGENAVGDNTLMLALFVYILFCVLILVLFALTAAGLLHLPLDPESLLLFPNFELFGLLVVIKNTVNLVFGEEADTFIQNVQMHLDNLWVFEEIVKFSLHLLLLGHDGFDRRCL